jgi:hypothetical protein
VSNPDTPAAFKANKELHTLATSAATPKGYTNTFKDLNAAVSANTYLGFKTLKSYDVQGCAAACDNTKLCTGFNVYIERDPAWNPDNCSCGLPKSTTNFKCSLWGSGVDASAATNFGQGRGQFEVVIVGSNGYSKTETYEPATPPHWTSPGKCSGIHNHPKDAIGSMVFKGPFDISLCAGFADAHNKKNQGGKKECKFFNAFLLKEDGKPVGTYCKLFTKTYQPNEVDYKHGFSNKYDFETSYGCSKK